jgi:hypothetical protein
MSTDQAQTKPVEFDFQNAFMLAATQRNVQFTVGNGDEKRTLIIRRWTLTQQMSMGHNLAVVLSAVANNLAKHIKLDQDGQVIVSFDELLKNTLVFTQVLASCSDHVFRVISGSIAPNFKTVQEAQEFAESLDIADAVQLILLIVRHNALTEETKKKFQNLADAMPKPANQSLSAESQQP